MCLDRVGATNENKGKLYGCNPDMMWTSSAGQKHWFIFENVR